MGASRMSNIVEKLIQMKTSNVIGSGNMMTLVDLPKSCFSLLLLNHPTFHPYSCLLRLSVYPTCIHTLTPLILIIILTG